MADERARPPDATSPWRDHAGLLSAFDQAAIGMALVAPDGSWLRVNQALCDIVGYSEQELLATNFQAITHPDDLEPDLAYVRRMLAGEIHSYQMEKRYLHKQGQVVWIQLDVSFIHDAEGRPLCFFGQIQDITRRKQADAERQVMFDIIHGVNVTANLNEFLGLVHQSLTKVLPAENCYVALYDRATRLFSFQFFTDEFDPPPPPQRLEHSCTAQVFGTGQPMLVRQRDLDRLAAEHGVRMMGTPAQAWLGVPLKTPKETIGVLTVQHYRDENAYTQRDLEFLASVGGQIAVAIERKRAEEELTKLSAAVQQTVDHAVITNTAGIIEYVNPSFERGTGYTREEAVGKTPRILNSGKYDLAFWHDFWRTILAGQVFRGVILNRKKSGELYYEEKAVAPLKDSQGRIAHFVSVGRDITDRMRAEQRLAASESRLRTIIEAEPECVKIVALDGTLFEINPAGLAMIEADSTEQVVGRPCDLMVAEEYREAFRDLNKRVCHGEEGALQFEIVGFKGTRRWLESHAVPLRNERGEILGALSVTRDITERKRALDTVEQLRRQNELLLLSAGEGIYGLDLEGKPTFVNPTAARMLGWNGEELLGRPMHALVHHSRADGTHYPAVDCPIYAAFHDGIIHHGDEVFWRKDGTCFPIEYTSTPIRGERGEILGAVVVFKDVTERRQLEEQLRQAQKMEAIGQLAGGVAHDFNNLLMVVTGHTEMLLDRLRPGDPLRRDVLAIQRAADRAAGLTRQLLAFGRRQVLRPRVMDLNAAIEEMSKMLARLLGESIEFVFRPDSATAYVKADPGQMEQVILNLALNARDAMPQGGNLTIETRGILIGDAEAPKHTRIPPGRYVLVVVSDTGVGMDAATQARIFEPFFTTKEKSKGTGLGLATVYGVVQQSGGFIWVESEPGSGTTFRMCLPQADEPADAGETTSTRRKAAEKAARATETVLLVEDADGVREVAREFLKSCGYDVLEASSSAEAFQIVQQHDGPIHLLLTDVVLPEISGPELAQRLTAARPTLKVLFMSGYADYIVASAHSGKETPTSRGEDGKARPPHLQKPFALDTLARTVREVLKT